MDLSKVCQAQGVDLIHAYLAQRAFGAKLVTAQGYGSLARAATYFLMVVNSWTA